MAGKGEAADWSNEALQAIWCVLPWLWRAASLRGHSLGARCGAVATAAPTPNRRGCVPRPLARRASVISPIVAVQAPPLVDLVLHQLVTAPHLLPPWVSSLKLVAVDLGTRAPKLTRVALAAANANGTLPPGDVLVDFEVDLDLDVKLDILATLETGVSRLVSRLTHRAHASTVNLHISRIRQSLVLRVRFRPGAAAAFVGLLRFTTPPSSELTLTAVDVSGMRISLPMHHFPGHDTITAWVVQKLMRDLMALPYRFVPLDLSPLLEALETRNGLDLNAVPMGGSLRLQVMEAVGLTSSTASSSHRDLKRGGSSFEGAAQFDTGCGDTDSGPSDGGGQSVDAKPSGSPGHGGGSGLHAYAFVEYAFGARNARTSVSGEGADSAGRVAWAAHEGTLVVDLVGPVDAITITLRRRGVPGPAGRLAQAHLKVYWAPDGSTSVFYADAAGLPVIVKAAVASARDGGRQAAGVVFSGKTGAAEAWIPLQHAAGGEAAAVRVALSAEWFGARGAASSAQRLSPAEVAAAMVMQRFVRRWKARRTAARERALMAPLRPGGQPLFTPQLQLCVTMQRARGLPLKSSYRCALTIMPGNNAPPGPGAAMLTAASRMPVSSPASPEASTEPRFGQSLRVDAPHGGIAQLWAASPTLRVTLFRKDVVLAMGYLAIPAEHPQQRGSTVPVWMRLGGLGLTELAKKAVVRLRKGGAPPPDTHEPPAGVLLYLSVVPKSAHEGPLISEQALQEAMTVLVAKAKAKPPPAGAKAAAPAPAVAPAAAQEAAAEEPAASDESEEEIAEAAASEPHVAAADAAADVEATRAAAAAAAAEAAAAHAEAEAAERDAEAALAAALAEAHAEAAAELAAAAPEAAAVPPPEPVAVDPKAAAAAKKAADAAAKAQAAAEKSAAEQARKAAEAEAKAKAAADKAAAEQARKAAEAERKAAEAQAKQRAADEKRVAEEARKAAEAEAKAKAAADKAAEAEAKKAAAAVAAAEAERARAAEAAAAAPQPAPVEAEAAPEAQTAPEATAPGAAPEVKAAAEDAAVSAAAPEPVAAPEAEPEQEASADHAAAAPEPEITAAEPEAAPEAVSQAAPASEAAAEAQAAPEPEVPAPPPEPVDPKKAAAAKKAADAAAQAEAEAEKRAGMARALAALQRAEEQRKVAAQAAKAKAVADKAAAEEAKKSAAAEKKAAEASAKQRAIDDKRAAEEARKVAEAEAKVKAAAEAEQYKQRKAQAHAAASLSSPQSSPAPKPKPAASPAASEHTHGHYEDSDEDEDAAPVASPPASPAVVTVDHLRVATQASPQASPAAPAPAAGHYENSDAGSPNTGDYLHTIQEQRDEAAPASPLQAPASPAPRAFGSPVEAPSPTPVPSPGSTVSAATTPQTTPQRPAKPAAPQPWPVPPARAAADE